VNSRDGSWSHSSRRDHSGFNGCCTAMWKANGKTTTLVRFQDSLFPEVWKRLWTYRKTNNYYLKFTRPLLGNPFANKHISKETTGASRDDITETSLEVVERRLGRCSSSISIVKNRYRETISESRLKRLIVGCSDLWGVETGDTAIADTTCKQS
jgi:hypothetical protein